MQKRFVQGSQIRVQKAYLREYHELVRWVLSKVRTGDKHMHDMQVSALALQGWLSLRHTHIS